MKPSRDHLDRYVYVRRARESEYKMGYQKSPMTVGKASWSYESTLVARFYRVFSLKTENRNFN